MTKINPVTALDNSVVAQGVKEKAAAILKPVTPESGEKLLGALDALSAQKRTIVEQLAKLSKKAPETLAWTSNTPKKAPTLKQCEEMVRNANAEKKVPGPFDGIIRSMEFQNRFAQSPKGRQFLEGSHNLDLNIK